MSATLDEALAAELAARHEQGLWRRRRVVESPQAPELCIDSRQVISFCSNDYLGLAAHPQVSDALAQGAARWGTGSGASHLISGHTRAHQQLEEELADFIGRPRALVFSSGYMANLGVASALLGRGDRVLEDRLNHASLLDAGLLSGARLQRFAHADVAALATRLTQPARRKLVMSDGVFSMDGDIAPLPELADVCAAHDAWLMVDDAHGLGVVGADGRGTVQYHGLSMDEVPILMGTLGKALGTYGAFVAGSDTLIEALIQFARTYIYTTALPAAVAEASRIALKLAVAENWRRERLATLIAQFRHGAQALGLSLLPSETPIQPLMIGAAARASALSEALLARGVLVAAIRPPTVPAESARLRISLSAAHTEAHVEQLLQALEAAQNETS